MLYNAKQEMMTAEELEQVQIERLQSTLLRAYRSVAFYRQSFDAHRVDIERVKGVAALRQLPFTTREDLGHSYPYDMFAVPLRDVVRIHSISGAANAPISVGYTRNDLRHCTECTARLLTAAGINAGDVVQIAFPYNLFLGGYGFHQGAEQIGASVIPSLATATAEKQVILMRDFKTTTLICTPGYALQLAHALEEAGVRRERLCLRAGIFGGEPWSEATRGELEERLGAVCLDTYGLSDVMGPGLAGECREHNGLHVNEDHFIVEVIDPRTLEPVARGGEGELVFTTITREAFPVIRFRTGDLGALAEGPCPCGRRFARIRKSGRRTDDRFYFEGVGIFPAQIGRIVDEVMDWKPRRQIVLDRRAGRDSMEVRLEVTEGIAALDEIRNLQRLRERVEKRVETALDVRVKAVFVEPSSLEDAGGAPVVDRRAL
jgi:phenylacetate-CoA ligase